MPGTIEIALLVSLVSLGFAMYSGIANLKRNKQADDKKEATELTTVIVKLETIGEGVSEIKRDMQNIKSDVQELRERIATVENSAKSAHHRIDLFEGTPTRPSRASED